MQILGAGGQPVPYLAERLRPVAPPDPGRLARLIADLDSKHFPARRHATAELERLGELAAPTLRKQLDGQPSAEVRRRLEQLLDRLTTSLPTGEQLQEVRAVQILEQIATPEAKQVLTALVEGAEGARLTREAKSALERLAKPSRRR